MRVISSCCNLQTHNRSRAPQKSEIVQPISGLLWCGPGNVALWTFNLTSTKTTKLRGQCKRVTAKLISIWLNHSGKTKADWSVIASAAGSPFRQKQLFKSRLILDLVSLVYFHVQMTVDTHRLDTEPLVMLFSLSLPFRAAAAEAPAAAGSMFWEAMCANDGLSWTHVPTGQSTSHTMTQTGWGTFWSDGDTIIMRALMETDHRTKTTIMDEYGYF